MGKSTEKEFLQRVGEHIMTVLRDEGGYRHVRFGRPGTRNEQFDLITWPGHLCYTGDMGTYVFSRIRDMFEFFRTDRLQPRNGQTLFINQGYWAEKVLAYDKTGKIQEYDRDLAEQRLREALKEMRRDSTSEERAEIYDEVSGSLDDGEVAFKTALMDHFPDSWEWDLTEYTFSFTWCCYAIAWGIQQYDDALVGKENVPV
ncbi:MAG: hypothetical protein Q7U76_12695 [Nitrospirota bacterium]|nr:hypothetical protein [Nitrospirota bacterium]